MALAEFAAFDQLLEVKVFRMNRRRQRLERVPRKQGPELLEEDERVQTLGAPTAVRPQSGN